MSKPRLTKEQKEMRKKRLARGKQLNSKKNKNKIGAAALLCALAVQEFIKGKD